LLLKNEKLMELNNLMIKNQKNSIELFDKILFNINFLSKKNAIKSISKIKNNDKYIGLYIANNIYKLYEQDNTVKKMKKKQ